MIIFCCVVLAAAIVWKVDSVPLAVFLSAVIVAVSLDGIENAINAVAERK